MNKLFLSKHIAMPKVRLLFALLLFLSACRNKKPSLSGEDAVQPEDFFGAFQPIKTPFSVADTNLNKLKDTTLISLHVIEQFIPDTVLSKISKSMKGMNFYPVGKIEKNNSIYLLIDMVQAKKSFLDAFLFDKKYQYIDFLPLLNTTSNDGYFHSLSINSEPTFMLSREKTAGDQYLYTRKGYAYSKEARDFIVVVKDGNEDKSSGDIINPIDTLPRLNKRSGDYVKNKKNFISVRDGRNANNYLFFTHFEKDDGNCTGELKGSFTMTSATHGVYKETAGPCAIDFEFAGNNVTVKEQGNCGNHRGITCAFDDTYKKKKEAKPKTKKPIRP